MLAQPDPEAQFPSREDAWGSAYLGMKAAFGLSSKSFIFTEFRADSQERQEEPDAVLMTSSSWARGSADQTRRRDGASRA
eukprot:358588-Rhodomonas_salina.1